MRKVLLFMLGVLMTLPTFAQDFEYTYKGQTVTYSILSEYGKTVTTKRGSAIRPGNSISGDLVLPEHPKNGEVEYTLWVIDDYSFYGCSELTSIVIPNSVVRIGQGAFTHCSKLTSVIIPYKVSVIERSVFDHCTGLSSVNIPNSVTSIENFAFRGCTSLESVVFGSSVSSIGAQAFSNCNLSEVVLSPATKTIGESAFKGNNLKNIAMGANVTVIGGYAFDGANSLDKVSITAMTPPAAENTTFSNYDCPLYVMPSENNSVIDAYYNFTRCWYRFTGHALITMNELKISGANAMSLKPGESAKLEATFSPADASLPYIFWRSTNPNIATVDKDGNVTMVGNGDNGETCQIIAESLYADGPVATVTITKDASFVEDIYGDSSFSSARSNDIYTLQGVCVKRNATSGDIDALTPGLYIIGGKKVMVK